MQLLGGGGNGKTLLEYFIHFKRPITVAITVGKELIPHNNITYYRQMRPGRKKNPRMDHPG